MHAAFCIGGVGDKLAVELFAALVPATAVAAAVSCMVLTAAMHDGSGDLMQQQQRRRRRRSQGQSWTACAATGGQVQQ